MTVNKILVRTAYLFNLTGAARPFDGSWVLRKGKSSSFPTTTLLHLKHCRKSTGQGNFFKKSLNLCLFKIYKNLMYWMDILEEGVVIKDMHRHGHLFTWWLLSEPFSHTQVRLWLCMTSAWCPFRKGLLPVTGHWPYTLLAALEALVWMYLVLTGFGVKEWPSWRSLEAEHLTAFEHRTALCMALAQGVKRCGQLSREGLGYAQRKSCCISHNFFGLPG